MFKVTPNWLKVVGSLLVMSSVIAALHKQRMKAQLEKKKLQEKMPSQDASDPSATLPLEVDAARAGYDSSPELTELPARSPHPASP